VVGTGGSARAAAAALVDAFPGALLEVGSRSLERAQAFATWAGSLGARSRVLDQRDLAPVQLLLLATPDPFAAPARDPEDRSEFTPWIEALLDLRYAPGGTPIVRLAREALHIPAEDGRGVLVAQGAASFERFFGVPAPVSVMRQAVEDALRA
jgi:shikimate dehydrogenase